MILYRYIWKKGLWYDYANMSSNRGKEVGFRAKYIFFEVKREHIILCYWMDCKNKGKQSIKKTYWINFLILLLNSPLLT